MAKVRVYRRDDDQGSRPPPGSIVGPDWTMYINDPLPCEIPAPPQPVTKEEVRGQTPEIRPAQAAETADCR